MVYILQGRTVDFKNTLIIMTSNVGSSVIEKGGGGLGFQLDTSEEDSSYNRIKTLVNEELKQYFRPEFLNRCPCYSIHCSCLVPSFLLSGLAHPLLGQLWDSMQTVVMLYQQFHLCRSIIATLCVLVCAEALLPLFVFCAPVICWKWCCLQGHFSLLNMLKLLLRTAGWTRSLCSDN